MGKSGGGGWLPADGSDCSHGFSSYYLVRLMIIPFLEYAYWLMNLLSLIYPVIVNLIFTCYGVWYM